MARQWADGPVGLGEEEEEEQRYDLGLDLDSAHRPSCVCSRCRRRHQSAVRLLAQRRESLRPAGVGGERTATSDPPAVKVVDHGSAGSAAGHADAGRAYREALAADMRRREAAYSAATSPSPTETAASPTASPPGSPLRGFSADRPLHAELQNPDCRPERVAELLAEGGLPPHVGTRDEHARLPAHVVAMAGARAEILTLLIEHGGAGQTLAQDNEGRVPLHYAAQRDSGLDGCLYLLSVGGQRQLFVQDAGGRLPIHLAAANNDSDRVLMHLFAVGGARQLSVSDCSGRTPLHYAAMLNDSVAAVRYLVEVADGGPHLFVKDKHGQLPIHVAAQHNPSAAVVEYLLRAGGPAYTQLAAPTSHGGMSPIHLAAASNGSLQVVQAIVAVTGDTTTLPKPQLELKAIAQIARTNPNEAVIEFLVHHYGWRLCDNQGHSGVPLYRQGKKGVWRWMVRRHDAAIE